MNQITYQSYDEPIPDEIAIVDAGLDEHNFAAADFDAIYSFACFARDDSGTVIGGTLSRGWGKAYELQYLWVREDCRKAGIGARLMSMVEDHAVSKGCQLIYLETFTFQASDFYLRLGYQVDHEYKGFPNNTSKFHMSKVLNPAT